MDNISFNIFRYLIVAPTNMERCEKEVYSLRLPRRIDVELSDETDYNSMEPNEIFDLIIFNNSIQNLGDWKSVLEKAQLQLRHVI